MLRVMLVIGDAIALLVFAGIGRLSHGETAAPGEIIGTAAPFLLGWFLASPWLGAYRVADDTGEVATKSFLGRSMVAWLVAWPISLALRALFMQREIPISFAITTFLFNSILLMGWRSAFALLVLRRSPQTTQTTDK